METKPRTLRDVLPLEYKQYLAACKSALRVERLLDEAVVFEHTHSFGSESDEHKKSKVWPGTHRYVQCWWELANGYGVGWNENPKVGHSFPVMKLPESAKVGTR